VIRYADEVTARRAVTAWGGDPGSLAFLGKSGSAAWRFLGREGRVLVLRLIDPTHRDHALVTSELAFVEHLAQRGASVAEGAPTDSGMLAFEIDGFVASSVTWVPGDERSAHTGTPAFDHAWGRALATLHAAARDYTGPRRWEWNEEPWLAEADRLLPPGDRMIRARWAVMQERLAELPRDLDSYGTIHGDHGPQNFRYDEATGTVTTFDFGNACRHWYAMDVTVALSTLRRDPDRAARGAALLEGYRSIAGTSPPLLTEAFRELLRLRFLYVYLSRLDQFGPSPTPEEAAQLAMFRALVLEGEAWPLPPEVPA